ncbi:MAG: helicase-associated domain-containing protein [Anaerolineae bacterium]
MEPQPDRQRLYALTERDVRRLLDEYTRDKAEGYYHQGHIVDPSIEGATLHAHVRDAPGRLQVVEITLHNQSLQARCTCSHQQSTVCEHAGAVLLGWVRQPESFRGFDPTRGLPASDLSALGPKMIDEYVEVLGQQTIIELRELGQQRGIEVKGTRKDPIVEQLAAALADPQVIQDELRSLEPSLLELLTYVHLVLEPGYGFSGENLVRLLSERAPDLARHTLHRQVVELADRGLLLRFKRDQIAYYLLPYGVRTALPPHPGLAPLYPEDEQETLKIRSRQATSIVHSMYLVWNYIGEHTPHSEAVRSRLPAEGEWPHFADWDHIPEEVEEVVQRRRTPYNMYNASITVPTPRYHLRTINRQMMRATPAFDTGQAGDEEIEFCYALLDTLGAIHAGRGQPIVQRREAFQHLLSLAPTVQMYVILYTWLNTTAWSEMDMLRRQDTDIRVRRNLTHVSFKPQDLYREWRSSRQMVLRFLSTVEEGQWISVQGFMRAIWQITPDLLHPHAEPSVWWLESYRTRKQFGATFEDWQDSAGRFVLTVLQGPLYWLGAVQLGYHDDRLVAFRVTPVGSFALHRRSVIVEQEQKAIPAGAVQLSDNLSVTVVPGQVPAQLHELLHLIGQIETTTPDEFVYRITADGVLRALGEGQTIDRVLGALTRWLGKAPPPSWKNKMVAWSENYGKLHIYDDITLIELADDYALHELLSNTSLRDYLVYEFSPRLVAVHPEAVDDLVQEMEKRGYTPAVE